MKQKFFTVKFMQALGRSYLVPCRFWNRGDEEFYAKNILPPFRRFMKDLLPKLKKCDGSVNTHLEEILITCKNRDLFALPDGEYAEIGAVITQRRVVPGQPVAGMVFGFTPKKIVLAGGIFGLEEDKAERIKEFICEEKEKYTVLADNEEFAESFGREGFCHTSYTSLLCENETELLVNANFAGCTGQIPGRFITDDILPDIIIAHYKGIKALNRFLAKALKAERLTEEITV